MKMDIVRDIEMANRGRLLWLHIKDKHCYIDQSDCVVLIATHNDEMIQIAMEELPAYMQRKYFRKALVIQNSTRQMCRKLPDGAQLLEVKQVEMECLLKYYRLVQFTRNIVVISVEEPFGNDNIIGHEEITLRNYVADGLYV